MGWAERADRPNSAQRLRVRAVFPVALLVFLVFGIVLVGDFSAQWWLLILPVALLVGPALALRRSAARRPREGRATQRWSE